MGDLFSEGFSPIVWVLIFTGIGAGLVLLAKIYGLLFMTGNSPHRVGDTMNVNRAEVTEWTGNSGMVLAGGELWRATSSDELEPGDDVIVKSMRGLVLEVSRKQR